MRDLCDCHHGAIVRVYHGFVGCPHQFIPPCSGRKRNVVRNFRGADFLKRFSGMITQSIVQILPYALYGVCQGQNTQTLPAMAKSDPLLPRRTRLVLPMAEPPVPSCLHIRWNRIPHNRPCPSIVIPSNAHYPFTSSLHHYRPSSYVISSVAYSPIPSGRHSARFTGCPTRAPAHPPKKNQTCLLNSDTPCPRTKMAQSPATIPRVLLRWPAYRPSTSRPLI